MNVATKLTIADKEALYKNDSEVLAALNAQAFANEQALKIAKDVADIEACYAKRVALKAIADHMGYIRVFDLTFKLNLKKYA